MLFAHHSSLFEQIGSLELPLEDVAAVAEVMRHFIAADLTTIPAPGSGFTFVRWKILARVGATDLSLAKIFESHTDALAILTELETVADKSKLHAVWAAEDPRESLAIKDGQLTGRKAWCSGASEVDIGLLTASNTLGDPVLVRVAMDHHSVHVLPSVWQSSAMRASGTTDIRFEGTPAEIIGPPRAYHERPGFWHGGAGIAAV